MAVELARAGILEQENVKSLGTRLESIEKAEDRDLFRDLMRELDQPVPESTIVTTLEEALDFANEIGYPVIVRPAYTLEAPAAVFAQPKRNCVKRSAPDFATARSHNV